MKLYIAVISASVASAFSPQASYRASISTALDASTIYYSTQTGNTETCAGYIAEAAGLEISDVGDAADSEVLKMDSIIVGAPTWHTDSDTERSGTSWDSWLYDNLPNIDMSGKKVAVFGCGDQQSYE
jgi:flavodoxin I